LHLHRRLNISQAYCVEILKKLREEKGLNFGPWLNFHHDNATAHKELSVKQFLLQKSIPEMFHCFISE